MLLFTLCYLDLEVDFPKEPVTLIVTGGRAGGRTDGRAGDGRPGGFQKHGFVGVS